MSLPSASRRSCRVMRKLARKTAKTMGTVMAATMRKVVLIWLRRSFSAAAVWAKTSSR
ncbi:hypothetical protein D3C87_2129680 [compost metagenome]